MKNIYLLLLPYLFLTSFRAESSIPKIYDPGDASLSIVTTSIGNPTPNISPLESDYSLPDAEYFESTINVTAYLSNEDASMQIRINGNPYTNLANEQPSGDLSLNFGNNIIEILVTAQDQSTRMYTFLVRRNRSSDANLSFIMTSIGSPTSSISPLQSDYFLPDAEYFESSINVTAYLSNEDATMQIRINSIPYTNLANEQPSGDLSLNFGDNIVEILVTAQDQSTRMYTFLVRRNRSSDANLSFIMTSIGSPTSSISPLQSDYFLPDAEYFESSINVTAYLSNEDATMQIRINSIPYTNLANEQPSGDLSLNFGDNIVEILVTAQDQSTRMYTFLVRRNRSSDANLSFIMTSIGSPTSSISPLQSDYFLPDADYLESSIMVTAYVSNMDATMQIRINSSPYTNLADAQSSGALSLNFGDNIIEIRVTAQDQSTRTYSFFVRRNRSSDASLSYIMTSVGSPTSSISPLQSDYFLPDADYLESSIMVTAYVSNMDATMQIRINGNPYTNLADVQSSGDLPLNFGDNLIEIRVTAQDQLTRTYSFMVRRNRSSDADLSDITTSIGSPTSSISPLQSDYFLPDAEYFESSIMVTAYVSNMDATMQIRINGNPYTNLADAQSSGALPLNFGDNIIEIRVTAQDQLTRTYSFLVRRNRSSDADLAALTISDGTLNPAFSAEVSSYTVNVTSSTASLKMTPTLANPGAIMEIKINDGEYARLENNTESGSLTLNVGENVIQLRITFQDVPSALRNARVAEVTKVYEFIVTRDNPLPVTLIAFTGKKSGAAQSTLTWITADEKDFSAFEIQKSTDAKSFEKVGSITAKQTNGSHLNAYTFYDEHASEPAIYYRLKMIDTDGTFKFSRIISINNEAEISVVGEFYPNPVLIENVSVDIITTSSGTWKISTVDILGVELHLAEKELRTGENKVLIPVRNLKSGMNLIRFENNGKAFVRRIIRY